MYFSDCLYFQFLNRIQNLIHFSFIFNIREQMEGNGKMFWLLKYL